MSTFLDLLNESAVVYIRDLNDWWSAAPHEPGWEAISPTGEVQAFATREEAHAWRVREVIALHQ